MSQRFASSERELCEMFAGAAHGPRRNGLFALWLLLRVAGDAMAPTPYTERARRRRAEALARRLGSLTLPGGLLIALRETADLIAGNPNPTVPAILRELAPKVREALGARAASVLLSAADQAAG